MRSRVGRRAAAGAVGTAALAAGLALALALAQWAGADGWTPPQEPAGSAAVSDGIVVLGPNQGSDAVWYDATGVHAAHRPAGGAWSDPVTLPGTDSSGFVYGVAADVSRAGELTVAWLESDGDSSPVLHVARRAPGQSGFAEIPSAGQGPPFVQTPYVGVAYDGLGVAHVAYTAGDGGPVEVVDVGDTAYGAPSAPPSASGAGLTDLSAAPVTDASNAAAGAVAVCWESFVSDDSGSRYVGDCAERVGGEWVPTGLSVSSLNVLPLPRAAFGPGGALLVAGQRDGNNGGQALDFVLRRSAGTTSGSLPISADSTSEAPVDVAIDGDGTGVVAWMSPSGAEQPGPVAANVDADGAHGTERLDTGPAPGFGGGLEAERLAGGGIAVAYATDADVRVVRRTPSAVRFGSPATVGQVAGGEALFGLSLSAAPDPTGELQVSWLHQPVFTDTVPALRSVNPGEGGVLEAAALDRTGPEFDVSGPSSATAGDALTFTASGRRDAWSSASGPVTWRFGDGGTATGDSVSHTFAGAGTYEVEAAAADDRANTTTRTLRVVVDARPAGPGGGPPPPPRDVPPPLAWHTGLAEPISGTVLVKLPGDTEFRPLTEIRSIPVGTLIDARHGVVRLTVAVDNEGHTGVGDFSGGIFEFTQHGSKIGDSVGRAARHLIDTNLTLAGRSFRGCPLIKKPAPATTARRRRVRFLRARAHGRFRTVGRSASGIERGTSWTTTDTCDATVIHVSDGAVDVDDLVRGRSVRLEAGDSYRAPHAPGIKGVSNHTPNRASLVRRGLRFRQRLPGAGRARWRLDLSVWDKPRARVARHRIPPPRRIGRARARVRGAGSVEVRVRLTRAGRRLLARHPRARLVLRTRFKGDNGPLRSNVLVPL